MKFESGKWKIVSFFLFPLPWGREKNRFEFGKNENLILRERVLFNGKLKVENGKLFRFFIPSPKIRRRLG